jgi:uncharacterized C2H2 Zn-finger protein
MSNEIKCPRCGMGSGTTDKDKANAWYRCHIALTCRQKHPPAPCVNSDAQQETTHEDDAQEYLPCPICKATDPNFDGYCQQCEIPLERRA